MNDMVVGIVAGIVSGLLTGTLTCWFFYWLSGRDLRREADDLRRLNILIVRSLQAAGIIEVTWDAQGNPLGLVYRVDVTQHLKLSGSALANFKPAPPNADKPPE
jgi:hypothetical protein